MSATLYALKVISSLIAMEVRPDYFGGNLAILMRDRQLTSVRLAQMAGVGEKTINNVINGRHGTQLDILTKICGALDVELWQMFLPPGTSMSGTFPRLLESASGLSPEAMERVTHYIELELKAGK